jgi:hypothetical protein
MKFCSTSQGNMKRTRDEDIIEELGVYECLRDDSVCK